MKTHIHIHSIDELEEEAADAVGIYEDPPDGANPENDDDPLLGEEGILVVETEKLEVMADFPIEDFPEELSFPVSFIGWDETYERMEEVHGLETHQPADVTISLRKKWKAESGKSIALYDVSAE